METQTVAPETPVEEKASRWEDFIDIFISPAELFRRRVNENWTVPIIAVGLLSMIIYFGFPSVQRAFADAQIAQMIERRPELAERMAGRQQTQVQNIIGGMIVPIAMALAVLLTALFTWIAAKFASVQLSWRKALMINAWVAMIGVLNQLAINVVAFLKVNRGEALNPMTDRSVGLVHFMDPETNGALMALLTRIDVFAIWTLIVMAIAIAVTTGAPKSRAYATATIVWFASALPYLLFMAF